MTNEQQAALAAWESSTVQNLDPHLTATEAKALWDTMLGLRDSGDVEAFTLAVRDAVPVHKYHIGHHVTNALAALATIFPSTES